MNQNLVDVVARYEVKITYDSNGDLFDININDGVRSVSIDKFEDISDVIKEFEEACY